MCSITILDLSSFDTRRVYDMCYMFKGCESLTTIYVETNWITANATKSIYMFLDCELLVGGAGTTYDSTKTDKTYARIDGGESAPGYFTLKTF